MFRCFINVKYVLLLCPGTIFFSYGKNCSFNLCFLITISISFFKGKVSILYIYFFTVLPKLGKIINLATQCMYLLCKPQINFFYFIVLSNFYYMCNLKLL